MNATVATYNNVLGLAQRLDSLEQLRLLEALATLIRHRIAVQSRRSLLELQGLGKEIWQGIDAQAYVNRERASWTG